MAGCGRGLFLAIGVHELIGDQFVPVRWLELRVVS
jgi:hypothetical protein